MKTAQARMLTIWKSIDELKAKRNVITLYRDGERVLREVEYHNREVGKGRGDNPLFIVFYGDLGEGDFYLAPAPLDAAKDAKVPVWRAVYTINVVDNCEALAYWLLRYPICDYVVTEQAAKVISRCAQVLKEAGSRYQIECEPRTPIEAAGVKVKVYAPVKEMFVGDTPLGKMAVLPAEGEAVGVKYTYPLEIVYSVLRENPGARLRVEGATELALRLQICKEFGLCVAPVDVLSEGRPLPLWIRDRAVYIQRPRVYITNGLEYAPAIDAQIREVELVPVKSVEEALLRAANEHTIPPPPETHIQLCMAAKKLGIPYLFQAYCNIMSKGELLAAARNMAGAEPKVITLHPHVEGIPRSLIVRDNDGTIYLVLESADAEFYYVDNKVVTADLCTALKRNNMAYPSAHPILGPRCSPPPAPPRPPPLDEPPRPKETSMTTTGITTASQPSMAPPPPPPQKETTQPSPPTTPPSPPPQSAPQPPPPPADWLNAVRNMALELARAFDEEIKGDPVEWLIYRWDYVMDAVKFYLRYKPTIEELDEAVEFYRRYKPVIEAIDEKCLRRCTA